MELHQPSSFSISLLLLTTLCGTFQLTLGRQHGVWDKILDDIFVLEHTTASFNWTHSIGGNVHILWEYIGNDNHREDVLTYARGDVNSSTLNYRRQRADYVIFPGSATMTLQDVTPYDEGTYQVSIGSSVADSFEATTSVKLIVISASDITVRVVIDGEISNMSVAENGTNVTLPDSQVVFLANPSITIEVVDFVSTPLSISTKYDVKENPKCEALELEDRYRKLSCSWFNDINIKVTFNIQNADVLHIRKKVRNQVPWKTIPGNVTVLANTSALFNWTHDIPGPVDITWYYRMNNTQPGQKIMSIIDGVIATFPGEMSSRIRHMQDDRRSAAVKLENVVPSDEGFYEVDVVDRDAASNHKLSNLATLIVIGVSALEYSITIDGDPHHLSFVNNGTDIILPDAVVFVPVTHTLQFETTRSDLLADMISVTDNATEEPKTWRHTHNCIRSFEFNSQLAVNEVHQISIYINFGIQNMKKISVRYVLHLNSSVEQNMGENTCDADPNTGLVVACALFAVVCVILTVSLLIMGKKYKDVQNHNKTSTPYVIIPGNEELKANENTQPRDKHHKRTTSECSTNGAMEDQ